MLFYTKRKRPGDKSAFISAMALEALHRIHALFDIERDITAKPATERLTLGRQLSASPVADPGEWITAAPARLSPYVDNAKAINYMLNR